jgi:hypothetical protein
VLIGGARRGLIFLALALALATTVAGCGESPQVKLQHREFAYQKQVAAIDKPFAHPSASPRRDEALLSHAIRQYEALTPPTPLRALNARVLAGLKGELRAFRDGLGANGEPAAVGRAEALGARSRAQVNRALRRLAAVIGACGADAAHC